MEVSEPVVLGKQVTIALRSGCNYHCSYCVAQNARERVRLLPLDRLRRLFRSMNTFALTTFECGAGEPTLHPQIRELLELGTERGAVSLPTNNSQDPDRWMAIKNPQNLFIRAALHPQGEEDLAGFTARLQRARELGASPNVVYVAHPERLDKVDYYKKYFGDRGILLEPTAFNGTYRGRSYPGAYSAEEKSLFRIEPENWPARLQAEGACRDFKGIPCLAGFQSLYVDPEGNLRRCLYDDRVLDAPLPRAVPCRASHCGCGILLEELNSLDYLFWFRWHSFAGQTEALFQRRYEIVRGTYRDLLRRYGKGEAFPGDAAGVPADAASEQKPARPALPSSGGGRGEGSGPAGGADEEFRSQLGRLLDRNPIPEEEFLCSVRLLRDILRAPSTKEFIDSRGRSWPETFVPMVRLLIEEQWFSGQDAAARRLEEISRACLAGAAC